MLTPVYIFFTEKHISDLVKLKDVEIDELVGTMVDIGIKLIIEC